MEIKTRLILKHTEGRFLSWDRERLPLTHKLSEARRFSSTEAVTDFLANSYYRPEVYGLDPGDFEIIEIEILYREKVNEDVRVSESPTTPFSGRRHRVEGFTCGEGSERR